MMPSFSFCPSRPWHWVATRSGRLGWVGSLSDWASDRSPLQLFTCRSDSPATRIAPLPGRVMGPASCRPLPPLWARPYESPARAQPRHETTERDLVGPAGTKFHPHRLQCPAVSPLRDGIKKIQRRTPDFFLFLSFGGEQLVDLAKDSSLSPPANIIPSNLC